MGPPALPGRAPAEPFPGAQPVKPELPITPQTRTLPAEPCVNCHRNFFPLGYALENFDPIGRWRTHDQAGPVDASGAFVDGTSTNGVVELRQVLLQTPGGLSHDDHREAARLRVHRIGGSVRRNARDAHPRATDTARHAEASLVLAHRGYRAGELVRRDRSERDPLSEDDAQVVPAESVCVACQRGSGSKIRRTGLEVAR